METCRACPAPLLWAKQNPTEKNPNPKPNPLNADADENGNLRLDRDTRLYDVLTGDALKEARERGEDLFISHFVTCPARKQFRKAAPRRRSGVKE